MEPNIELTLTGNGRGEIEVEGDARSDYVSGTHLHFKFFIDQTFLPKIADGLIAADPR